jgi:glycosyltransferase involved in cell wall biosynthesis
METEVLKAADKIVTINSRIKDLISLRYPFKKDEDIIVIPQGFDPQDFNKSQDVTNKTGKMRITYSGSFLNYYTPKHFLDGLKQALSKKSELKDKVEACFIGTFPEKYKDYIKQLGIESMVNTVGYIEHSVCVKYLMESNVLWMMINKTDGSDLHSTGKLYEYFGARKPILACVPEGVARKSLENYGAVKLTLPDDSQSIAEAILEYYDLFEKDLMPKPNEELINHYDRRNLTKELAIVFDLVTKKLSETVIS